jgi:hypothetical protein
LLLWPESARDVAGGRAGGPRGYDAGKKIKGRKRHILTDTIGLGVGMIVHRADVRDRDGAPDLLASVRSLYPCLSHIFADLEAAAAGIVPLATGYGRGDEESGALLTISTGPVFR